VVEQLLNAPRRMIAARQENKIVRMMFPLVTSNSKTPPQLSVCRASFPRIRFRNEI
jgi:hypothetical protein